MARWTAAKKRAVVIPNIIRPLAACSGASSRMRPWSATSPNPRDVNVTPCGDGTPLDHAADRGFGRRRQVRKGYVGFPLTLTARNFRNRRSIRLRYDRVITLFLRTMDRLSTRWEA